MSAWSFILEAVGLTGAYLAGRKKWWAWTILLANALLWAAYGIQSKQYGFIAASVFYAPVYARNAIKWRRRQHE